MFQGVRKRLVTSLCTNEMAQKSDFVADVHFFMLKGQNFALVVKLPFNGPFMVLSLEDTVTAATRFYPQLEPLHCQF